MRSSVDETWSVLPQTDGNQNSKQCGRSSVTTGTVWILAPHRSAGECGAQPCPPELACVSRDRRGSGGACIPVIVPTGAQRHLHSALRVFEGPSPRDHSLPRQPKCTSAGGDLFPATAAWGLKVGSSGEERASERGEKQGTLDNRAGPHNQSG